MELLFGKCRVDTPLTLMIKVAQTDYDDLSEAYSVLDTPVPVREYLTMFVEGESIGTCDPEEREKCGDADRYTCTTGHDVTRYLFAGPGLKNQTTQKR